jgi:hypothetical protein
MYMNGHLDLSLVLIDRGADISVKISAPQALGRAAPDPPFHSESMDLETRVLWEHAVLGALVLFLFGSMQTLHSIRSLLARPIPFTGLLSHARRAR